MRITYAVNLKKIILLVGDIGILYASLFATLYIRFEQIYTETLFLHLRPFTMLFFFWLLIFFIIGLYDIRELKNTIAFNKRISVAIFINFVFGILFFYFIPSFQIAPKTNLFILLIIFGIATYIWRVIYNNILKLKTAREQILLIGDNEATQTLAEQIRHNPQWGYVIAHWIQSETDAFDAKHLKKILLDAHINLIVVSAQMKRDARLSHMIYQNLLPGIGMLDLIDLYEIILKKTPLTELHQHSFTTYTSAQNITYSIIKRFIEFLFACVMSVITLPLCMVIGLLIKVTSPGSAFFTQRRVGKARKQFILWKFRTMVYDAEKHGPQWSQKNDARITTVGRFLRKTHIDELPQLWNIIRGDLSLIGPRPERPEFVQTLEKEIPYYHLRHVIRPGLTGWAQINYRYGASTADAYEKLQYDIFYLKNRSWWLDIITVIKTVKRLFVSAQ